MVPVRTPAQFCAEYAQLADAYQDFLLAHDRRRAERWFTALHSGEPEGQLFEATVWRLLSSWGVIVVPEPEEQRGPDFRCHVTSGDPFYIEATARRTGSFAAEMGIGDTPLPRAGTIKPSHDFHGKLWSKTAQASSRPDLPVLIAYGSLHPWIFVMDHAIMDEALGVETSVRVGGPEDQEVTRLSVGGGAFTDCPMLAGLLFLPSEASSPMMRIWAMEYEPVRDVLNLEAKRPFDSGLLPQVRWLRADAPSG